MPRPIPYAFNSHPQYHQAFAHPNISACPASAHSLAFQATFEATRLDREPSDYIENTRTYQNRSSWHNGNLCSNWNSNRWTAK